MSVKLTFDYHLEMVIWSDLPEGTRMNNKELIKCMNIATAEQRFRAKRLQSKAVTISEKLPTDDQIVAWIKEAWRFDSKKCLGYYDGPLMFYSINETENTRLWMLVDRDERPGTDFLHIWLSTPISKDDLQKLLDNQLPLFDAMNVYGGWIVSEPSYGHYNISILDDKPNPELLSEPGTVLYLEPDLY